jgi:hypothetical protein
LLGKRTLLTSIWTALRGQVSLGRTLFRLPLPMSLCWVGERQEQLERPCEQAPERIIGQIICPRVELQSPGSLPSLGCVPPLILRGRGSARSSSFEIRLWIRRSPSSLDIRAGRSMINLPLVDEVTR